jgi:glycerophosphoryl diester phosphodiesterase
MRILGHRGASADFAENTLPAFLAAAEQGADGVELDVMRCASGELVVCHDERLDRLAGVQWWVRATPWWKLQKADIGTHLGFAPARMPLLEEVLDALPRTLLVNVELKCEDLDDRGLTQATGELLMRRGEVDRVLLSSFNPVCLLRLGHGFPELKRGQLIDPDRARWPQALYAHVTGRDSIHPHFSACTPGRVQRWRDRGLRIAVWTVDDEREAWRLEQLGVDYVITNQPAKLIRSRLARNAETSA